MAATLLLADDSVTVRRVLELTFADEDIRIVSAGSGEEAIGILGDVTPDIVLVDVDMPGRDGYEIAAHIRSVPRLAHVPVLLLARAFEPIDEARAAVLGCAGVLTKPFEPQLVIQKVRQVLEGVRDSADVAVGRRAQSAAEVVTSAPSSIDRAGSAGSAADEYFERLGEAFSGLQPPAPTRTNDREAPRAIREQTVRRPQSLAQAFAALLAAEQESDRIS